MKSLYLTGKYFSPNKIQHNSTPNENPKNFTPAKILQNISLAVKNFQQKKYYHEILQEHQNPQIKKDYHRIRQQNIIITLLVGPQNFRIMFWHLFFSQLTTIFHSPSTNKKSCSTSTLHPSNKGINLKTQNSPQTKIIPTFRH